MQGENERKNKMKIPESILKKVQKPARYTGGEWGQIVKPREGMAARVAFCFPDTYEIGMSNIGMRILYDVLNKCENIACERCFAPWDDMEEQLREHKIPLCTLENSDPLYDFDIVAFTLQYELCYTTMINMLELGGVEILSSNRKNDDPLVLVGGPCTFNSEPFADFVDACIIGEGEEVIVEFTNLYIEHKKAGFDREKFLHEAAKIEGVYVPAMYKTEYNDDGTIKSFEPIYQDVPRTVRKRIMKDMDKSPYPEKFIVPFIQTVQDRITLEVYRGCIRGCRFCQAGQIFRPVREKSVEVLCDQARKLADSTGYGEMTLSSLSISDYTCISKLTDELLKWTDDEKISLSLPSLRVDSFTKELMDKISTVRTGTLTFAPEAGTQRLRDVINKNVFEDDLYRACRVAFEGGKSQVKLYFMQGLPTETDEDLDGINALCEGVIDTFYNTPGRVKKAPQVTISCACFIPKPFTAFQWEPQCDMDELLRKQQYLKGKIMNRKIRYNYHDATVSRIEAVFARGDRKLGAALLEAHKRGMRFDSWEEFFSYEKWLEVFDACCIDPAFYANRERAEDEILPWDNIDIGVTKEFLLREKHNAHAGKATPNCREKCAGCGANKLGGERACCPSLQK